VRFHPASVVPVALLLLAMGLGYLGMGKSPSGKLGALPVATGHWQGPLPALAGWQPEYSRPDDQRRAAYSSSAGTAEVYLNLYMDQAGGRELIRYGNNIIAPVLWKQPWVDSGETMTVVGQSWAVRRMRGPDQRVWLVVSAYVVAGRLYRSETAAKLAYGWYSLAGPAPSGILAAATACDDGNCDNARLLVADFWENMQFPIRAMMPVGASPAP
jgi:EpsI family protein